MSQYMNSSMKKQREYVPYESDFDAEKVLEDWPDLKQKMHEIQTEKNFRRKPNLSKELVKNLIKTSQQKQDIARRKLKAHQENKPTVPQIHITKQGYFTVKTSERKKNTDLDGSEHISRKKHEKLKGKQFKRNHNPNKELKEINLQSHSVDIDNIQAVDQITKNNMDALDMDVGQHDIEKDDKGGQVK